MNITLGDTTVDVQVGDTVVMRHRLSKRDYPGPVFHIYDGRVYVGDGFTFRGRDVNWSLTFDSEGKCTTPANGDFQIVEVVK
jgi:hypothetical protein